MVPLLTLLYGHPMFHNFSHMQSIDQPGKVANPARGQLNREKKSIFSLSQLAPENLVSRDWFGRPVPRHPAVTIDVALMN